MSSLCSLCLHRFDFRLDVEAAGVTADLLCMVCCAALARPLLALVLLSGGPSAGAHARRQQSCCGWHPSSFCWGQSAASPSAARAVGTAAADVKDLCGVRGRPSRLRSAADCRWSLRLRCRSSAPRRRSHCPSPAALGLWASPPWSHHPVRVIWKWGAGRRSHPSYNDGTCRLSLSAARASCRKKTL